MPIALSAEARREALESLQAYARENLESLSRDGGEPLGTLAAGGLLDSFLQEIGPCVYNKAVQDVKDRLEARLMELDVEVYEPEFTYWQRRRR